MYMYTYYIYTYIHLYNVYMYLLSNPPSSDPQEQIHQLTNKLQKAQVQYTYMYIVAR